MASTFVMGLDLGPPGEPTGFAILERPAEPGDEPQYQLRHTERFPAGTSYPVIVESVAARANAPTLKNAPLVVDRTAVGRAVIDRLGHAVSWMVQVVVGAGQVVQKAEGGGHLVPKKELVTSLQLILQSRRLKIAPGLPASDVLVAELTEFRLRRVAIGD